MLFTPRIRTLGPALALLAVALGCGKQEGAAPKGRPPPLVTTQKVIARSIPVEVSGPVDLRPIAQADVGAKTLGYLDAVLVDRGDRVRKGQLLALVRPSDLPDQAAAARSQLAQAQAQLSLAQTNFERASKLAPSGIVSQQELQQATAARNAAEAAEAAAKAQLGVLAVRLGETRLEAPLDGVVVQRRLDPGALVGPATPIPILTVARTDVLRVFLAAGERDVAGITVGKDAHVELDALPGQSFAGRVARMAPGFDPTTRTLEVEVHLPNPTGELRPGMYGRGSVVVDTHPNAVVVPAAAVLVSGGRKFIFVVQGDRVKRKPVEIGVDGGDWLEIIQGLAVGEDIVTAGAEGLADGSQVRTAPGVNPYTGERTPGAPEQHAPRAP